MTHTTLMPRAFGNRCPIDFSIIASLILGLGFLAFGHTSMVAAQSGGVYIPPTVNPDFTAASFTVSKGVAKPGVVFRTRKFSSAWHNDKGNVWIFGGYGKDAEGRIGLLNDLWMWDGSDWVLLSGSMQSEQPGVYALGAGKEQVPVPGARMHPQTWVDDHGVLWLFGGFGRDTNGNVGRLDDVWTWDGVRWRWISGPATVHAFPKNAVSRASTQPYAEPASL